jgi:hypothetical protein
LRKLVQIPPPQNLLTIADECDVHVLEFPLEKLR